MLISTTTNIGVDELFYAPKLDMDNSHPTLDFFVDRAYATSKLGMEGS